TDGRWLYVWDSEQEASAFAEELKKQTRDRQWFVRPVNGKPSLGPLRPLEINVGHQGDGWTFGLEPLTRKAIEARFPGSCRRPSVFIGSPSLDAPLAEQPDLRELAERVLFILTGLKAEALRTFGHFWVVDPVDGRVLLPATPIDRVSVE